MKTPEMFRKADSAVVKRLLLCGLVLGVWVQCENINYTKQKKGFLAKLVL